MLCGSRDQYGIFLAAAIFTSGLSVMGAGSRRGESTSRWRGSTLQGRGLCSGCIWGQSLKGRTRLKGVARGTRGVPGGGIHDAMGGRRVPDSKGGGLLQLHPMHKGRG